MQIYVLVALPYRLQSLPLLKWLNQMLYGRDYTADHNGEYNTKCVMKLYYYKYYPEWDPDSSWVITSYGTTMKIDYYKSISESSPSNRYSLQSRMKLDAGGAMPFKKRWITIPESQTTPTVNNYGPGSGGMKHCKIHSPIVKPSSSMCTWRWID